MQKEINIVNTTNQDIYILPIKHSGWGTSINEKDTERLLYEAKKYSKAEKPSMCNINRVHSKSEIASDIKMNITNIGTAELPPVEDGTIYIVTNIVYNAYSFLRKDIYIVDEPVKDNRGRIVACRSLARPSYKAMESELEDILKDVKGYYKNSSLHAQEGSGNYRKFNDAIFNAIFLLEKMVD